MAESSSLTVLVTLSLKETELNLIWIRGLVVLTRLWLIGRRTRSWETAKLALFLLLLHAKFWSRPSRLLKTMPFGC